MKKLMNKLIKKGWKKTEYEGSFFYDKYYKFDINASIEIDTEQSNKVGCELYFTNNRDVISQDCLNELNKAMKEMTETVEMIRKELK